MEDVIVFEEQEVVRIVEPGDVMQLVLLKLPLLVELVDGERGFCDLGAWL